MERDDDDVPARDQTVLDELDQMAHQQPSWAGAAATLVVSLLLFMAAAGTQDIWDGIFILIPVLLFHEAGHYVTMRFFGYRNLRMFFVPFFGAAVSGRHYNVAGWQKALVALAGPLPGILVAMPIGVAGLTLKEPTVIQVALWLVILNGFNLLPFLPLDGGWVVHAVLFVRHPVVDLLFRIAAGLALLGLSIALFSWCLGGLAILMLLATPLAYRQARIAQQLREEGLVARSLDADTIPRETALQILAEVRRALSAQTAPKVLAQQVAAIFEACNAEPPGVLVSLGLLGLHGAAFLAALVMGIVLTVMQHLPG